MTPAELRQKYSELQQELFQLRFQAASGQIEKPHLIKETKREIARVLTIMKEGKK